MRSGHVALSAASTPPQGDEPQVLTESAIPPGPSTLPSQLSASQALRMLDSEFDDDTELLAIADTLVSLGAPPTYRPPPLPVQPPQWASSAPTPAGIGGHQDLTFVMGNERAHLAAVSALSLPKMLTWLGIQHKIIVLPLLVR